MRDSGTNKDARALYDGVQWPRAPAVQAEGDPLGLVAHPNALDLLWRHHRIVEDVEHLVRAVAEPEFLLIRR